MVGRASYTATECNWPLLMHNITCGKYVKNDVLKSGLKLIGAIQTEIAQTERLYLSKASLIHKY